MKKHLAIAGLSTIVLASGAASAADMAPPVPAYAPVAVVARPVWTGCYFGANAGGLWVHNDNTFAAPVYSVPTPSPPWARR